MADPLCKERSQLLDSYYKASADLIRMNRAFSNAVLTPGNSDALAAVWGEREAARRRCGDLRRQIFDHVEAHGCGAFDPPLDARDPAA